MNHQVLTWGNGKESNCNMAPIDSSAPAETSKWGPVSPKRLQSSNLDLVRSSREVPPQWMVNRSGELNSGESSLTAVNTRWNGICTNDVWSGDTENTQGEAITSSSKQHSNTGFSSGGSSKHFKESCYAVDVPVGDIAINGNKEGCNPNGVPNEMVPWLQYPLDASLEQNYCTDFFGQLPSLSTANIQDLRDSFTGGHAQQLMQQQPHHRGPSRFMRNQFPHYDYLQRIATADAALAQGAGRVAGLLPTRAGVEAFTKVRTCLQQPDAVQGRYSPTSSSNCGKADVETSAPVTASLSAEGMPSSDGRRTPGGVSSVAACGSTSTSEHRRRQQQQAATFPPPLLQTPAPESIALPQAQTPAVALVSPVNFPQFSVPSVEKKHVADVARREEATKSTKVSCSTPAQRSAVPPPVGSKDIRFGLNSPAGVSSSKAESTPMNLRDVSERKTANELEQKSEGELHGVRSAQDKSMWPAVVQNSRLLDSGNSGSVDPFRSNATAAKAHPLDRDGPLRSGVTACETRGLDAPTPIGNASIGNASIGNAERRGGSDLQSYLEPTFTTPAGPPDKAKKTTAKGKRRAKDESDSQMDESEDGSPSDDLRRTQSRGREVKRTRAAEVHNLSERRRRDRINEKMRALQELIPNSNKADKASMLDEAIEYLKMLQVQLQMMSMRNGMGIPSMIPTNMQHMQMGAMPPWGMGLGMGMGIGVGMGAGMGVGMGTSMGPGMGTSMGAGMGPGMGAGMGPGMGAAGLGAGMGAGMGASMGAGMGMGVGMGVGMGMTPMMIGPGTEIKRVNHTGAAGHQPLNLVSRQPDGSQQVGGPLFPPLASPYYHSTSFPR